MTIRNLCSVRCPENRAAAARVCHPLAGVSIPEMIPWSLRTSPSSHRAGYMEFGPDPASTEAHHAAIGGPCVELSRLAVALHRGQEIEGWTTKILPLPWQARQIC